MGTFGALAGMVGMDPRDPYEQASKGAKEASNQFRDLSNLQWQRQMEGLSRSLGGVGNYRGLYDAIYGTNTASINQGLQPLFQQGGGPGFLQTPAPPPPGPMPAGVPQSPFMRGFVKPGTPP